MVQRENSPLHERAQTPAMAGLETLPERNGFERSYLALRLAQEAGRAGSDGAQLPYPRFAGKAPPGTEGALRYRLDSLTDPRWCPRRRSSDDLPPLPGPLEDLSIDPLPNGNFLVGDSGRAGLRALLPDGTRFRLPQQAELPAYTRLEVTAFEQALPFALPGHPELSARVMADSHVGEEFAFLVRECPTGLFAGFSTTGFVPGPKSNQDGFVFVSRENETFLAWLDGLGGCLAGDIAAQLAADSLSYGRTLGLHRLRALPQARDNLMQNAGRLFPSECSAGSSGSVLTAVWLSREYLVAQQLGDTTLEVWRRRVGSYELLCGTRERTVLSDGLHRIRMQTQREPTGEEIRELLRSGNTAPVRNPLALVKRLEQITPIPLRPDELRVTIFPGDILLGLSDGARHLLTREDREKAFQLSDPELQLKFLYRCCESAQSGQSRSDGSFCPQRDNVTVILFQVLP